MTDIETLIALWSWGVLVGMVSLAGLIVGLVWQMWRLSRP